jgi:zinc transporter ZupT
MRRYDAMTVFLLLVGGVILPVVGWLLGAVMLLGSRTWSTREKLFGLLVLPGGLAVAAGLVVFAPTRDCVYLDDTPGHHKSGGCTGTAIPAWLGVPLLVLTLALPVLTAILLSLRARRFMAAQD